MQVEIDNFNRAIKQLGRIYVSKSKKTFDSTVAESSVRRLNMAISANQTIVMSECGPYLIKYGDIIQSRNWPALLAEPVDTKNNDVQTHVEIIKRVVSNATPEEMDVVGNVIGEMLSSYCRYRLAAKKH
jgi:hypothetical protein